MSTFLIIIMLTTTTPNKIPCVMINPFIAAYGQETVVAWARGKYSDAQITEVLKRCVKKK